MVLASKMQTRPVVSVRGNLLGRSPNSLFMLKDEPVVVISVMCRSEYEKEGEVVMGAVVGFDVRVAGTDVQGPQLKKGRS